MEYFSNKLIIFITIISLYFLCMPKMCASITKCCETKSCMSDGNSISIEAPFRLKDRQPESCGCPGFGLVCDDKLGLLIELPNAGKFRVDNIYTYNSSRELVISDPNNCLPQKLLSRNLTKTHFRQLDSEVQEFELYNCSGVVPQDFTLFLGYEIIDCLNGPNYTIVSVEPGTTVGDNECSLIKSVFVPTGYATLSYVLSTYKGLYLTWDKQDCELCESSTKLRISTIFGLAFMGVVLVLILSVGWWVPRLSKRYYERAARVTRTRLTTRDTNVEVVPHTQESTPTTTTPSSAHGLDQVTIKSYPTLVISKSRSLIKSHDDKCPICLSDYSSGDTLKILPECLHRFHVDCIDLWLGSKAVCPICRTSPLHNS